MPIFVQATRHGFLAHNSEDQVIGRSIRLYGEWAEEEIWLLDHFISKSDLVVDVGANVGSHSIAFARMVGPDGLVIAIDGQLAAYNMLAINSRLNEISRFAPMFSLVGSSSSVVLVGLERTFEVSENLGARSFKDEILRSPVLNGPLLPIPVTPIDALKLPRCDLIKIDVEGMELDVILGSTETLTRHHPTIYFEQTSLKGFADIFTLLSSLDYSLYWHVANPFNTNNFCGSDENIFGGAVEVNVLALPLGTPLPPSVPLPLIKGPIYDPDRSLRPEGWRLPNNAYAHLECVETGELGDVAGFLLRKKASQ